MFFRKMITILIISLKLSAEVCCNNFSCSLFPDSSNCSINNYCIYVDGACRDKKCSELGVSYCSGFGCRYDGSQCVDAVSCADFGNDDCNFQSDANTGAACIKTEATTGAACREQTCADYGSGNCTSASNIGGWGNTCRWSNDACRSINSCSDFDGNSNDCPGITVNGYMCFYEGAQCKSSSDGCAGLSTTTDPSCADQEGNGLCSFSNGVCRELTCSDYSGTSTSGCEEDSGLFCTYTDNVCAPTDCGSLTSRSSCGNKGCYYLKSCPVDPAPPPADNSLGSQIFAPALLVALLALVFW